MKLYVLGPMAEAANLVVNSEFVQFDFFSHASPFERQLHLRVSVDDGPPMTTGWLRHERDVKGLHGQR